MDPMRIAIQGEPGAFSHLAAEHLFGPEVRIGLESSQRPGVEFTQGREAGPPRAHRDHAEGLGSGKGELGEGSRGLIVEGQAQANCGPRAHGDGGDEVEHVGGAIGSRGPVHVLDHEVVA